MTIEISNKKYWTELNWYDSLLYLSMLDIGGHNDWRMPTLKELIDNDIYGMTATQWVVEDSKNLYENSLHTAKYLIIPVRTIEPG